MIRKKTEALDINIDIMYVIEEDDFFLHGILVAWNGVFFDNNNQIGQVSLAVVWLLYLYLIGT